ncbi:hypothetical protein N0V93_002181 [Gnomoniopsis smithogilvyi]|uniref:Uncharacterized protein n=1 Tax=Gnomoniopsis smithogilvyi TaxID=1191159 RepID=A0A9W8YY55_9PEZI|nr:hypothetical protein N0V93_002181 [Gnomoniopsis smithogilvyi]
METQKGNSSFRMQLARVSVDGDDQPIAREATLCLRTQQAQTMLPGFHHHFMDIYIDGDLMACWDLSLLKHHLSYQLIRIFSSFAISKHISMTLPLPLNSPAASQNNDDDLKNIRLYFNKAQGFHTAISWLSKQAEMVHRDGRPATTLGFHSSSSSKLGEQTVRPSVKPSTAPSTQPPASHLREKTGSRPQSRGAQLPAPQQSGHPQSRIMSLDGREAAPQYLQRPRSRLQSRGQEQSMFHGFPAKRRPSNYRQNMFALQEADRSVMAVPNMGAYINDDKRLHGVLMPRVGDLPTRTMSAAPMGATLPPRYSGPFDGAAALHASLPTALDAHADRLSPKNPRVAPHFASSQEENVPSGHHFPATTFEPDRGTAMRLSQIRALGSMPTQSTIRAHNMSFDVDDSRGNALDVPARRRRVMSMAPSDARIPVTSPDPLNIERRSNPSSQNLRMSTVSDTLPRVAVRVSGVPPPSLCVATAPASQAQSEEDPSFKGACAARVPAQIDDRQTGYKRPPSAQAERKISEKRRKANQPMKRATRQVGPDNAAGDSVPSTLEETQTEMMRPALAAPSLDYEHPMTAFTASKDTQMVDRASQTEPPSRRRVDVLHLSAALKLDAHLLQETTQWENLADLNQGLLSLSTQLVKGLYDMCRNE